MHQEELIRVWDQARQHESLDPIAPLQQGVDMLDRIVSAEARDGYRLWVRFEDGSQGEVDLGDLVGRGVFASWTDRAVFERVFIDEESGTVTWPGGVDLAPDGLYQEITDRQPP